MKTTQLKLFASLLIVIQASCGPCNKFEAENAAIKDALNERLAYWKSQNFVMPDTINTSLVVASFYEWEVPSGYSLIVYTDSLRTAAKKLKYLDDSAVAIVDDLIRIDNCTFKSKFIEGENYIIKENSVGWILQDGNLSATKEYPRIEKGY